MYYPATHILYLFSVDKILDLSCSSVVPFGGANKELALDCIAESGGNLLVSFCSVNKGSSKLYAFFW